MAWDINSSGEGMFKALWLRFFLLLIAVSLIGLSSALVIRELSIRDFREYLEAEFEDRVYWVMADIEGTYERYSGWNEEAVSYNVIRALILGLDIRIIDKDSGIIMDRKMALNRITPLMRRRVLALSRIEEDRDIRGEFLSYPLFIGGKEIGTVDVRFIRPEREEIYIERTNRFLIIALIGLGGLSIFLSILFARKLTAPIKRLAIAAEAIKRGEFSVSVPVAGSKEIASLSETFNNMVKSLKLQEDLRKRLISNIAHELRTPISAIRGELEGMIDGLITAERSQLQSLYEEIGRLSRIVEGIEEFTMAQASALSLKKEPVRLKPFLENITELYKKRLLEKRINIESRCDERLIIEADPEKLSRIVINLLSNAIKAVKEDGRIWIKAEETGGEVLIEIGDNGCGIKEEDIPFIFERFYKGFDDGIGLGLSIVKELVDAHRGRIDVRSEYGKGTVFRVYLKNSKYGA